jgi:rod shape determining protein RodA
MKRGNFDYLLLFTTILLSAIGILMIYSATEEAFWMKQILWFGIGVVGMILVLLFDYSILKKLAPIIYLLTIAALIFVLKYGVVTRHTKSWIYIGGLSIQPSEFAKLSTIILLAKYLSKQGKKFGGLLWLTSSIIILAIPLFLILKQPDLGTSLLFLPTFLGMLYVSGVKRIYIICLCIAGALIPLFPLLSALHQSGSSAASWNILFLFIPIILILVFLGLKISIKPLLLLFLSIGVGLLSSLFVDDFLKDYQKKRLLAFVKPEFDPLGVGYSIIQSKVAIGSGKIFGRGFLSGTQTRLGFLPERHGDFIFSAVGEQLGFLGSLFLLLLFFIIMWRGFRCVLLSRDMFGALLATGVVGMFASQVFINIGMTTGIMPVVGIPLPLVSYGGSSLTTTMIGIGILMNIRLRRLSLS